MKKSFILLIAFILFSNLGCEDNSLAPNELPNTKNIIVSSILYEEMPDDAYRLKSVELVRNYLVIYITFGCGLGVDEFNLVATPEITQTNPPQMKIRVSLLNEDISCMRLVGIKMYFDLTPIQDFRYNEIILNLKGWDIPINYHF